MLKEKKYKVIIDTGSASVNVLAHVPVLNIWYFVRDYPQYKKYTDVNCNSPLWVYRKYKVGYTALWKLANALVYTLTGDSPFWIKRTNDELKNFNINMTSEMRRRYLVTETGKPSYKYYLNDAGKALWYRLRSEPYPETELAKANLKQEKIYRQAVEDSRKALTDYHNWETEKALANLA